MTQFSYSFFNFDRPGTRLIERSLSSNVDDVNRISIAIEVTNPSTGDRPDGAEAVEAIRFKLLPSLTPNASSITPIVVNHGDWEIKREGPAHQFVARPVTGHTGEVSQRLTFRFNDVEVSTEAGEAKILIAEQRSGNWSDEHSLILRKIDPYLRIDRFETTEGSATTLTWATTGATRVEINGVPMRTEDGDGDLIPDFDGSLDIGSEDDVSKRLSNTKQEKLDLVEEQITRLGDQIDELADDDLVREGLEQRKKTLENTKTEIDNGGWNPLKLNSTQKGYTLRAFGPDVDGDPHHISRQIFVSTSENNLGIGTSEPAAELHVVGMARADGVDVTGQVRAGTDETNFLGLGRERDGANHIGFVNSQGGKLSLRVNDDEKASLTTGGRLTVSNGLTVSAGGLTVSQGGLTVSEDGLTVSKGGLTVSEGGLTVSQGGLTVSQGGLTVLSDDKTMMSINNGEIKLNEGTKPNLDTGWFDFKLTEVVTHGAGEEKITPLPTGYFPLTVIDSSNPNLELMAFQYMVWFRSSAVPAVPAVPSEAWDVTNQVSISFKKNNDDDEADNKDIRLIVGQPLSTWKLDENKMYVRENHSKGKIRFVGWWHKQLN